MSHFYTKEGEMKDVRLNIARKEGLFPSVTTVLGILAKEGLVRWRINQAIIASLKFPKKLGMETDEEYTTRIFNESERTSRDARNMGTLIHKWIEYFFCNPESMCDCPYDIDPRIQDSLIQWVSDNVYQTLYCEKTFVNKHAKCACRADLIALLKDQGKSNKKTLIDFKSQGFDKKPVLYNEWVYQLAGNYICAIGGDVDNIYRWMNVVISTTNPGLIYIHEWESKDIVKARKVFKSALTIFKNEKNL